MLSNNAENILSIEKVTQKIIKHHLLMMSYLFLNTCKYFNEISNKWILFSWTLFIYIYVLMWCDLFVNIVNNKLNYHLACVITH